MAYIGDKPSQTLASPTSQYFNGDGSTVAFTLNRAVNVSEDLEVFVNNVQQEPGVGKSYTATGTTLTFDAAPSSGTANVYVVYRGLAEVTTRLEHDANAALAATTGTFSGDLTVDTNTLYVDSTNNRVGVGSASPSHPLTVNGQIKSTGTNGESVQLQTSSQYTGVSFVGSDGVRDAIIDYDHTSGVMGLKAHTSGHYITFTTGGYTERMRIDSSGRVTMPNQPYAFATTSVNNYTPSAGDIVQFDVTNTNRGGHYDTTNYRFTCPVAGDYLIVLWFSRYNFKGDLVLRKNGSNKHYLELRTLGAANEWQCESFSFVIPCAANDYLDWKVNSVTASGPLLDGAGSTAPYDGVMYRLLG